MNIIFCAFFTMSGAVNLQNNNESIYKLNNILKLFCTKKQIDFDIRTRAVTFIWNLSKRLGKVIVVLLQDNN